MDDFGVFTPSINGISLASYMQVGSEFDGVSNFATFSMAADDLSGTRNRENWGKIGRRGIFAINLSIVSMPLNTLIGFD